jgi:ketosteroid isomerase-like protein
MSHPNAQILEAHIAALSSGDVATAMSFYAADCTLFYPGRNPLSGTYQGTDEVLGFLGKAMELAEGTFHVDVHAILADSERVVALVSPSASRQGRSLTWESVDVYVMSGGKISEHRVLEEDQYAVDDFWASA